MSCVQRRPHGALRGKNPDEASAAHSGRVFVEVQAALVLKEWDSCFDVAPFCFAEVPNIPMYFQKHF